MKLVVRCKACRTTSLRVVQHALQIAVHHGTEARADCDLGSDCHVGHHGKASNAVRWDRIARSKLIRFSMNCTRRDPIGRQEHAELDGDSEKRTVLETKQCCNQEKLRATTRAVPVTLKRRANSRSRTRTSPHSRSSPSDFNAGDDDGALDVLGTEPHLFPVLDARKHLLV